MASADRTVRKQIKIDVQCNSFGKDDVDNKLRMAFVSAGIPFATITNERIGARCKMANRTFEHEWTDSPLKHIARTHGSASFMHKLRVRPRFDVAADKAKL